MKPHHSSRRTLQHEAEVRRSRKLDARLQGERSAWFGLGMFGLIGWSIAIPTLVGVAVGLWIDDRWPSRLSWTLMLMIGGVALGCWNAWWWVLRESNDSGNSDE